MMKKQSKYSVKLYIEMSITKTVTAGSPQEADARAKKRLVNRSVRLRPEHFIDQSTIYKLSK
jgi:hypothetical protein